jgi:hypothetical protein
MFQGLFMLAWIIFLFFMLGKYFYKPAETAELDKDGNPVAESVVSDSTSGSFESSAATSPTTDPNRNVADQKIVSDGVDTVTGNSPASPVDSKPKAVLPNSFGATKKLSSNEKGARQATDSMTASRILQQVRNKYAAADAYSDNGQLFLSYKFEDSKIDEEYPWRTAWRRDGNYSGDIFNARIQSDGKLLSCFVREFETRNLDNQQLFIDARQGTAFRQLFRDPIANYYLNGGERIPVNENVIPQRSLLSPSPLSLLTRQTESPWLLTDRGATRLTDETFEFKNSDVSKDCYVLRCDSDIGTLTAWIEKRTSIVQKIQLPSLLLDPMLVSAPEVRELELFAEFQDASFDASPNSFSKVQPLKDSLPVKQFVKVPEELPTNLLGSRPPKFSLMTLRRKSVQGSELSGRPTALLWIEDGTENADLAEKLTQVKKTMGDSSVELAVVVAATGIDRSSNGSWVLKRSIQTAANKATSGPNALPFLVDTDGKAQAAFELKTLPAVVLLDAAQNLQYARQIAQPTGYNGKLTISQRWEQDLVAAIAGLNRGKDIASDMLSQYRVELSAYFAEREKNSVAKWFPGFTTSAQSGVVAVPAKVRREQTAQRAELQLNPKLVWESDRLRTPGNVNPVFDSRGVLESLLILDGWQTVVQLDVNGMITNRKVLDLPSDIGVSAIRTVRSASGDALYAMFAKGGQQVHFFDTAFSYVGTYPKKPDSRRSIRDCQVMPGGKGKSDRLLICYGGDIGTYVFDPSTSEGKSAGASALQSVAVSTKEIAAIDIQSKSLASLTKGNIANDELEYLNVASGAEASTLFAATGMNRKQEWSLVGFDQNLKENWQFAIGSASFRSSDIEPISGVQTADGGIWAVADTENRIYLLSDDGKWLGDFDAGPQVRGLRLVTFAGRTRLVVSTGAKVECWELNFAPSRIGARRN